MIVKHKCENNVKYIGSIRIIQATFRQYFLYDGLYDTTSIFIPPRSITHSIRSLLAGDVISNYKFFTIGDKRTKLTRIPYTDKSKNVYHPDFYMFYPSFKCYSLSELSTIISKTENILKRR